MPEEAKRKDPIEAIVKVINSPVLKEQIARALPKQLTLDRFMRICLTTLRTRYDLQKCEPLSIVGAVMEASQLGLELDPVLGHGYLVPFHNKRNVTICVFIPGYRGFVHLMRNSGLVANVNAEIVRVPDQFEVRLGTERGLVHVPDFDAEGREIEKNWKGAYATVLFTDQHQDFEYMTVREINFIRSRSQAKDSGPWVTDTAEMWKKTPIRRIAKRMPLSPQDRGLIRAALLDEYRESDEYREKMPLAPALEPAGAIDVPPALPENGNEPSAAPEQLPKENVRRKSDGKSKPQVAEKHPPIDMLTDGQKKTITRLALGEKHLTREQFINELGKIGFENLDEIPKTAFNKVWEEIGSLPARSKQ